MASAKLKNGEIPKKTVEIRKRLQAANLPGYGRVHHTGGNGYTIDVAPDGFLRILATLPGAASNPSDEQKARKALNRGSMSRTWWAFTIVSVSVPA